MRWGAFILAMLITVVCRAETPAETRAATPAPATQPAFLTRQAYEPAHAAALVFSPKITLNQPFLDLSRENREPSAFVGFDDLTRTFMYLRTDDRWSADGRDHYERRAIIEQVSSRTR